MKKTIAIVIGIFILAGGAYFFLNNKTTSGQLQNQELVQTVLEKTMNISKEYVALRYRTDNVLMNAKNYPDYDTWNKEVGVIITAWENFDKNTVELESQAGAMAEEKTSFNFIAPVLAYDKQEISNIFDKAPAGKKIATLAKHLGVDAKMAYKILQQDQAQVEADAWTEAGDTFQKLETSATVIKDGCKVAGFVGGVIMTGGTSALATGSTLAKAAVIVSGADLTLEVTDDAAKIALGNHNKVSALVNDVRKVTEPIATILTISDIPNNLAKNLDKFNAAMTALDQFRGAAQEGKIIGVELPAYEKEKTDLPVKVAVLEKLELEKWLTENNIKADLDDKASVEKVLGIVQEQYAELKKAEARIEEAKEEAVKESLEEKVVESEVESEASSTDAVNVLDNSGILSIVSPAGKSFTPESGLSFAVAVSDQESLMTAGRNQPVWCRWNFFLDGKPYVERINPSIIHSGTQNVCEYSTLLIKQKGKLRVEFNLERGTVSRYSDEKKLQVISAVKREYIVK